MTHNKSVARRLKSREDAVEYFKNHQRTRGKDLQMTVVHSISWNADGTKLAVGSRDKRISVLNVDPSCRLTTDFTATTHDGAVDQVSFQPTGPNIFASASDDKSVCIWDVRQPKKHTRISTKVATSYVTWSMCGRYLAYHGRDDKINLMDSKTLSVLHTYDLNREGAECVCHPDGKHLFVATATGKIEVLSMPELEPVTTVQAHSSQSTLNSLAITKDGSRMAVGGNDALVTLWDLESMSCETSLPRMDYTVRALSFSGDGTLLATGSEDHFIDIAWVDDGLRSHELSLETDTYCLAWHPRHLVLAYACSSESRGRNDDIKLFF